MIAMWPVRRVGFLACKRGLGHPMVVHDRERSSIVQDQDDRETFVVRVGCDRGIPVPSQKNVAAP